MHFLSILRSHILALPGLAKFALVVAAMAGVPALSRKARLSTAVGLLVLGVALGPHALELFGENRPIVDFFGDLGKLLLMFSAGLEIDLALFRKARSRAVVFGVVTTVIPLVLGTVYGLGFGYALIPAIVIGSLLASHTLIALPVAERLGVTNLEPVVVAVGATVLSDTLSLIVFAICVSTFTTGFSLGGLALQIGEIVAFVPLILIGLSRAGALLLGKAHEEDVRFVILLGVMAVAGAIADAINLPGIVGAFLAGLAVNGAVEDDPAKERVAFLGKALFIPAFFITTGLLIDPVLFASSSIRNFPLVLGIIAALVTGKWIAAETVGRRFHYQPATRQTMWALTLPQVAATLAAALVAYDTRDAAGQRLIDGTMLNAVLVLMVVTSILGPVLTERFGPRMRKETAPDERIPSVDAPVGALPH